MLLPHVRDLGDVIPITAIIVTRVLCGRLNRMNICQIPREVAITIAICNNGHVVAAGCCTQLL